MLYSSVKQKQDQMKYHGRPYDVRGPFGNSFIRPRFQVNLHRGVYLYVLDKTIVDYTLARGSLDAGPNWKKLVHLA